ncbi:MAG: 16S rRNA (adenine(1518)-N(6)/adenine(1519)-N(6))-dimethyltransferase RsmA [Bacteroidales bacterium]
MVYKKNDRSKWRANPTGKTYNNGNFSDSNRVQAKKYLGQHFLRNAAVAEQIAESLKGEELKGAELDPSNLDISKGQEQGQGQVFSLKNVLEIGPGMGILTQFLWKNTQWEVKLVEIDRESVIYLQNHFPTHTGDGKLIEADFLRMNLTQVFRGEKFGIIGNFPYNISSQILFKVLENKELVPMVVGMFQKEVAERVAASAGSKTYGILSVLLQAFYDIEYLFTVEPDQFTPPPQVRSGVIRLKRNGVSKLDCNEKLFVNVVKTAFNQRRKTLRNALNSLALEYSSVETNPKKGRASAISTIPADYLGQRAEQLSVADFVKITQAIEKLREV